MAKQLQIPLTQAVRKEPRSKRRYPETDCPNPECQFGGRYEPHDRRQVYCCEQCRINHSNDRRYQDNTTKYSDEKLLRKYDKLLKKLYSRFLRGDRCSVPYEFFVYEQIDLGLCVEDEMLVDGSATVRWFYTYGTTTDTEMDNNLLILKRNL